MNGSTVIVGLLGGVASGKSTVAGLLGRHGARVVDADRLAHEALASEEVRPALERHFGPDAFGPDGRPDRARIAREAFEDAGKLAALEAAIHPRVRERIRREIESGGDASVLVLDAPLILEGELAEVVDLLVYVRAPAESRRERAERDRGWDAGEVDRRERKQATLAAKRDAADLVIDNDGSLEDLEANVAALWRKLVGAAERD